MLRMADQTNPDGEIDREETAGAIAAWNVLQQDQDFWACASPSRPSLQRTTMESEGDAQRLAGVIGMRRSSMILRKHASIQNRGRQRHAQNHSCVESARQARQQSSAGNAEPVGGPGESLLQAASVGSISSRFFRMNWSRVKLLTTLSSGARQRDSMSLRRPKGRTSVQSS